MTDTLYRISSEMADRVIGIRRHLHQYPELSFQEYETVNYICSVLNEWEIPYQTIGETGVYVDITGDIEGPAIGLRADIDALPIQEEAEVDFRSKKENVMHACGHDGHTAILLGTVYELNRNKDTLTGTVRCIFQPGEEADGAALALIDQGILENPKIESVTALHVWPYLPHETVGIKKGSMTASCDDFKITVMGKGGHSARPHQAVDAITVSSQILHSLQLVAAKKIDPVHPKVIHVGKINGGEASNIIASSLVMEGTYRSMNAGIRQQIQKEIERVCQVAEIQWNAKVEAEFTLGAPPIDNDSAMTELFIETARDLLGSSHVYELAEPSLGADDFGYFSERVPSIYFRLGIKKEDPITYDLHHPKFNFDDSVLLTGVSLYVNYAMKLLQKARS
ncbi:M20 family metallopeptidase [Planococcus sp. 4-30]|uniref:M20 metallopeptidase family protein n=1 Tax=Planococcus sp. 4-30 TaxID=2874583 RepID=UPI001CBCB760|nr:M20 family metallopeptidase [Planococcus sp. 4-30]